MGISVFEKEVANTFPEDYALQKGDGLVCYGAYSSFMQFWKSVR